MSSSVDSNLSPGELGGLVTGGKSAGVKGMLGNPSQDLLGPPTVSRHPLWASTQCLGHPASMQLSWEVNAAGPLDTRTPHLHAPQPTPDSPLTTAAC